MTFKKILDIGRSELWSDGSKYQIRNRISSPAALALALSSSLPPSGGEEEPPFTDPYPLPPVTGRTLRVSTQNSFREAALSALPGDTIQIVANPGGPLEYQSEFGAKSGAPGNHIRITSSPGIVLDMNNRMNGDTVLDVTGVRHVDVVGLELTRSQFGIRFMDVQGTASSPVRVSRLKISDTASTAVKISSYYRIPGHPLYGDAHPCQHLILDHSEVTNITGEGIYVGTGDPDWWDQTTDIVIRDCKISNIRNSEGIDVKPYTRRIVVEDNHLWDIDPKDGAAIVANLAWVSDNPNPTTSALITIRRNRINNVNPSGALDRNAMAIWSGGGGVDVLDNKIWDVKDGRGSPLNIWAPHQQGDALENRVRGNIVYAAKGIGINGHPGIIHLGQNYGFAGSPNIDMPRTEKQLQEMIA